MQQSLMSKAKKALFHLLAISLLTGFIFTIRYGEITQTFEGDYDEGLNLMKSLLYSQGFSLYNQIWSDQPPLFTFFLAGWFHLYGQSVAASRVLVLVFAALLVWCFHQIIQKTVGVAPALISALLLLNSWQFIHLSITVMIGIPSLALALFSIYFLILYRQHAQLHFSIISAGLFSLSLQTKLFTAFLIPLIVFYLLDFKLKDLKIEKNNRFLAVILWLAILITGYIFIGLLFQEFPNYNQVIQPHINQPINQEQPLFFDNLRALRYMLKQDIDYLFVACLGILIIFVQKQKNGLFPIGWLGIVTLILLRQKPIWYHYYPLLSIPICWLIAYVVDFVIDALSKDRYPSLQPFNVRKLALCGLTAAILSGLIIASPTNPLFGRPSPENVEITQRLLTYKESTRWVFTDRPIYAFRMGLRVPPETAVMSFKRFNSGSLTLKDLLSVLENYRPEQLVFARWVSKIKNDSSLSNYINENYSRTYTNKDNTEEHYLLNNS
jgi:4-amino-4-deoxy-L-arabinose transferase-like glycosyltransferase